MRQFRALLVVVIVFSVMGAMGAAAAQQGSADQPPDTKGKVIKRGGPGPQVDVLEEQRGGVRERPATSPSRSGPSPARLPFTGAHLTLLVVGALTAIGLGSQLTRHSRRRRLAS